MNRDSASGGDEIKRKERLGFVVLQHIQTMTADAAGALLTERIASDLAIPVNETRELLAILVEQGFVVWDGGTGRALATPEGTNYVLRVAGRRRSVRFQSIGTGSRPGPAADDGPTNSSSSAPPAMKKADRR